MHRSRFLQFLAACATAAAIVLPSAQAATPAEILTGYSSKSQAAPDPARGKQFFASTHGREWSCATCHGTMPVAEGRHTVTGKAIAALAPGANRDRVTDAARVEKWFRRNCNDVVGRECTPAEKADVLAWLITLQ